MDERILQSAWHIETELVFVFLAYALEILKVIFSNKIKLEYNYLCHLDGGSYIVGTSVSVQG